ncbi:oxidoreductase [Desulfitobacterium sp. AusDCA]|uniref:oxidoreductase n=1 Tax=Desulfitobacterium sp. AusDCA TaxID=3240383 RepID=UPI003DA7796E
MREIQVGLLGYGMAGQTFHAPILTTVPGLKLTKVMERHGEKAKERYPYVTVVRDTADILQDRDIELVVVATPNYTHYEFAKKALQAGKHVVVDKPFTVTSEEAKELIELAYQKNRCITAFQNRRWDGDFLTVQKVLAANLLGRVVEYECHYDRYMNYLRTSTWKESNEGGAGILYDLGSHLIDQALTLFGLPIEITADVRKQRDNTANDDQFEVVLHYEKLKVTLKAGMLVREPGPHFQIMGTEGSFIKFGLDPQEAALKKGLSPSEDPLWGSEPKDAWGTLNTEVNSLHFIGRIETVPGNYRMFYQNIYDAIEHQADLMVKPEDALKTIRVIELALLSNKEKRTVEFSLARLSHP